MATVLYVEDYDSLRVSMGRNLRARGYGVLLAEDCAKGLGIAKERLPDLVITDFNTPGMNGYEMATQLRANERTRGIRLKSFCNNRRHEQR
jgi:chemosensory pili system protein ChpA (sensor histidine kinase/response regulator)